MRKQRRHNSPVESLRLAIDCMPIATREAMLQAVHAGERFIAGAYVDRLGAFQRDRSLVVKAATAAAPDAGASAPDRPAGLTNNLAICSGSSW